MMSVGLGLQEYTHTLFSTFSAYLLLESCMKLIPFQLLLDSTD